MAARKTILAVDDDAAILRVVAGLLGGDHDVQTVESGAEAFKLLGKKTFDLIILDVSMPQMDGFEFLQAAMRLDPNQRVVMLTGDTDLEVVLRAMSFGAQGYLTKPFSGEDLKNVVDHLLRPYGGSSSGGCPWHAAPGASAL